jgi:hypothetical protein
MKTEPDDSENTLVETLFTEFNETLRTEGRADFTILDHCPVEDRKELLSLMNVAALAYRALAPEREAFQKALRAEGVPGEYAEVVEAIEDSETPDEERRRDRFAHLLLTAWTQVLEEEQERRSEGSE